MDGATAMSHSSLSKLHPVAPFSNLESQVPAGGWEASRGLLCQPRALPLCTWAANCFPAVVFQDKHIEEVRKNKEGKDPGEAETD